MKKATATVGNLSFCLSAPLRRTCVCLALALPLAAQSAQRTWTGLGVDAVWSTATNWTGNTVPAASDTVLFTGTGNSKTNLTLGSGANAAALVFAADAAAYTVGLPSETLTLSANATLTLSAGSSNSQSVASTVLAGGNLHVYNNESSKTLTLNYTNSASRNIYTYGSGPITFNTLRRPAGTESNDTNYIYLHLRSPAPVTCTSPMIIGQLWKDSSYLPSELILAPHTTNIICRNDWEFALSGATISGGEGTVLRLLHAQANTPAAIAVQTANPVTISVRLECPTGLATLNKGGGGWTRGTLVLSNPDNQIDSAVVIDQGNCFQVPFLAPNGTPNPLGSCPSVVFTNPASSGVYARLRVTGSTASSSDKAFTVYKDRAVIENAGTGTLALSGSFSGAGTFVFDANGAITLSGVRSGSGGLAKTGSGTLTLIAANTHTGTNFLEGGTLALAAGASLGSGPVYLAGGTLALNPAAADSYSVSLPSVTLTASSALTVPDAATASSVTLASLALNGYTLAISAPSAGSASNRIFVTGLAEGPASGIVLNGGPATYSAATGLAPRTLPSVPVTDDTLPDSPGSAATADTAPTGSLSIATALTTLGQFTYAANTNATLDLGGGILALDYLAASPFALSVINGTLTAAGATTNIVYPGLRTVKIVPLTSDATTDLSTSKTYSHLLDFGNQAAATINGVAFTKGASSGTGTGYSGFPNGNGYENLNAWTNSLPPETCAGLQQLLRDMNYAGNNWTGQLTGLTPGAIYEVTLYFRAWDAPPSTQERRCLYQFYSTSSNAADTAVIYASQPNSANAIVYRYMAPSSGTLKIAVTAVATSGNIYSGCFGLSNERLPVAAATPPTSGSLALSGPLSISAALADNGAPTALTAVGTNAMTLSGAVSLTGPARIDTPLTLAPASTVTQAFNGPVSGNAPLTLNGAGRVILNSANPAFNGPVTVSNGILEIAHSQSLGASTKPDVTVTEGGSLAIGQAANSAVALSKTVTIAGSGPDGLGALRYDYDALQNSAFASVVLAADAAVGGTGPSPLPYNGSRGRFDIRSGTLDFGGHALSKVGSSSLIVSSSKIVGAPAGVAVNVQGGVFGIEGTTDLGGSAANTASVAAGATFDLNAPSLPVNWTLALTNGARLSVRSGATNQNIWAGPVTLADGQAILDGQTSYAHHTIAGEISGAGGLLKSFGGYTYLRNPANTFSGPVAVTNSLLHAYAPGSVPSAPASLTVSGTGEFVARYAADGWSRSQIEALASSGAFTSRAAYLGIDTADADLAYTADWPATGVAKLGPYALTLTGACPVTGPIRVHDGTLDLNGLNGGALNLGPYGVQVGFDNWAASLGRLPLTGTTSITTDDNGYNRAQPIIGVGTLGSSRGVLSIGDSAFIKGRLYVGRDNTSAGAVYQSGGVFLNTGGAAADGRIGESGYGYYEISGGALTNKGYTQLGVNANVAGILRQTGGAVVFNSGSTPATGVIGDYYGGSLAVRAGLGLFHLTAGTLTTGASKLSLGEWESNINSGNDCTGVLTVEGTASASAGYVELANRNGTAISVVNLSGGSLATRYLIKGGNNNSANSRAYVNFNGGNLRITEGGAPVRTAANNAPAALTVYNGGASIEVDPSATVTLDLPLAAPVGLGLGIANLNSRGAGYLAPPFVNITGGGGTGATAVATIDRATGELTGLRITSPGNGFTSAPTVSLVGGGYTSAASVKDITIALNTSTGGLTKCGGGGLVLATNNTFRGTVTVAGGTLAARAPGAIPQGSDLVLSGGTLDLGGRALTNASVRIASGGGLVNGAVVTTTLNKDGAGPADLTSGVTLAPVAETACTPGLYEGRLNNSNSTVRSNRTDLNPSTSVQLTTRAVNGALVSSGGTINSCVWPDNTCYVYTGYLWNRTGTNAVWTFGENFDDNVYLLIDGRAILDNDASSTATYRNVLLTPGPHAFEVRCGQGGGNVGGNWVQTGGYRLGFGVDYLGRAQNVADNYQPLTDPGNGSLFTIDLPASYRMAEVAAAPSIPALPGEVTTNVGALASGYALVYASDIPASGGPINGSAAGTRYFVDNSRSDTNDFDRVAYYVELNHPTYGNQWVWVSFDAVTRDRTLIGYPFHDTAAGSGYCANIGQRKVSRMDVLSNVPGITNYTGCATGNIEFWPNNYGQADALALGASSSTATNGFDFGDTKNDGAPSATGHGSFQVHNWGDKTTLFALNNWGSGNNTVSLGIGNQPGSGPLIAPDWTFNYNGGTYTYRRLYVFTRDIVRQPKTPSAVVSQGTLRLQPEAISHPVPDDIRAKVGSAARDYDVVYASSVPVSAATIVSGTAYSIDNSAATAPFDRVAYYLELVKNNVTQYVWVAFNAHTSDRKKLGYPSQTGNLFMWQQKITNMDVVCNVEGVTNYTGSATGNIEIWPSNYSPATSGLGLGGNGGTFDFDDSGAGTTVGHGCFQIHNWGDKTTLLAISHLGSSANQIGTGIGNNPTPSTVPGQTDPDYTFTYNATQYVVRTFYVMVRPTARGAGASLASVDLAVASGAALDLGGATQTIHSITGAGSLSNGVLAAGTVLSPAGDNAVGALALSGVAFASGVQYRANLGDRLDVTGSLDVSGLQLHLINPEALDRSQTYTLIQTTAGISGAPTLDAPLPSGWKLFLRDNALILFADSGSILLLK